MIYGQMQSCPKTGPPAQLSHVGKEGTHLQLSEFKTEPKPQVLDDSAHSHLFCEFSR